MSEVGMWSEIERFLNQKKSFIGKSILVPYETIFYIFQAIKAPQDQCLKYLQLIENIECLEYIKDFSASNKRTDLVAEV